MKHLLQIALISFLLFLPVTAQNYLTPSELNQKNLEENGITSKSILVNSQDVPSGVNWTSLQDAPEPFGRSIGGKIGDFIYVFGGQANSSMAAAYQISTTSWVASTTPTAPAYNPSFCTANDELYKLSGTGAAAVFEKFTPDGSGTGTWTVLTSGSSGIMNSQSAMAWDGGDNIYVHSSSYSTPPVSYLSKYSISGNSWTDLTPTALTKRYAGLQFFNGYLYLIGGLVPAGDDATVCAKYDPGTDTWSAIASLPEAVSFCKWTTSKVPEYIVLTGFGGGYSTYPADASIYYYEPSGDVWTYDSETPALRGLALAFFVPDVNKLFFGGGNEGGSSTNYQASCWDGEATFIPVELVSFAARAEGTGVILNWITATETNNNGFEVERQSGIQWERIGFVQGSGTTTEPISYSFSDNALSPAIYKYRLKQIDFDGSYSYSNEVQVSVNIPGTFSLEQNFPNPFNPSTSIQFSVPRDAFVSLIVYNSLGQEAAKLIHGFMKSGNHTAVFNASGFSSGNYYYKLITGDNVEVRKMTFLK